MSMITDNFNLFVTKQTPTKYWFTLKYLKHI